MSLLIDGYNLLHAVGLLKEGQLKKGQLNKGQLKKGHLKKGLGPGNLERARLALLNFVVESLEPEELSRAAVVFDSRAAPPGLPRVTEHRGLKVYFASDHEDADALIEELIRTDSAPKQLIVVSGDHRLHRAARRRKATPVDGEEWYAEAVRRRRPRRESPPPAPRAEPSEADVDYWLRQFSDPALDRESRQDDLFPPDIGELGA